MANQYTSYYLYQKYEKRGSQDWLPCYPNIFSVDGDGTMPLSAKTVDDPECGYVPPVDPIYRWYNIPISQDYVCDVCPVSPTYDTQYLTFVAEESGTFKFYGYGSVSYSLDSGTTWNTLASGVNSPTVQSDQKIMWKGTLTPRGIAEDTDYGLGIGFFSSTGRFSAEGNIMSLLYNDNFADMTSLLGYDYAFYILFLNCTGLTSAENLILPATTLVECCYMEMFQGCTSLRTAPSLPATTLASNCYCQMFYNCTNLTTAPSLPATTLADWCYQYMFYSCTSLTTAPELPATALSNGCYANMFRGCTSLAVAPELPARNLMLQTYSCMFYGCTSLQRAPDLPASVLKFESYNAMFYGCSSLNYIKCLAKDNDADACTNNWLYGVSSSGTFVKSSEMYTSWSRGNSGIPYNWTVQDA